MYANKFPNVENKRIDNPTSGTMIVICSLTIDIGYCSRTRAGNSISCLDQPHDHNDEEYDRSIHGHSEFCMKQEAVYEQD